MESNKVIDALLGVAIGDAVGVPFEFNSRDKVKSNPAKGMIGYGTYNQPEGTWSDDSSLTFCLAESLIKGYSLKDISENFTFQVTNKKRKDISNVDFLTLVFRCKCNFQNHENHKYK